MTCFLLFLHITFSSTKFISSAFHEKYYPITTVICILEMRGKDIVLMHIYQLCILVDGAFNYQTHFIRSRKLLASWKLCNVTP